MLIDVSPDIMEIIVAAYVTVKLIDEVSYVITEYFNLNNRK